MHTEDIQKENNNIPATNQQTTEGNIQETTTLPEENQANTNELPLVNDTVNAGQTFAHPTDWIKKTMSTAFNADMIAQAKEFVTSQPKEIVNVNQLFKALLEEYQLLSTKLRESHWDWSELVTEKAELQKENQHLNESLNDLLVKVETFVQGKQEQTTEKEAEIPTETAIANQPKANRKSATWADGVNFLLDTWNVK